MNLDEKKKRYIELCHAMQTGVAFKMEKDSAETTPKHLRVAINVALSDHAALVQLLLGKGLIAEEEYWDALIASMEREVDLYQNELKGVIFL